MAINLQKGQKISLAKEDGSQLSKLLLGLGWKKAKMFARGDIDLDASVILLDSFGKPLKNNPLVYYGNRNYPGGGIHHCGDNLVGGKMYGMADSEQILIDLSATPDKICRMVFAVNIYDCVHRKQHFGMIKDAYIRIVEQTTNDVFAFYNLSENYDGKTTMIVGELYRHNGAWKFNAIGQAGTEKSIQELKRKYQ